MAPCRFVVLVALVAVSPACDDAARPPATLELRSTSEAVGGHLPPTMAVTVRTVDGVKQVAPAAFFAALGPQNAVAYVDLEGLHLWKEGAATLVAKAAPRGMSANTHGVAFAASAQSGQGSGIAFMSWSGAVRTLISAPEELPGQAGYHKPALTPDGRYVVAFGDLTPRPSLYRISLVSGEAKLLSSDAPTAVGDPTWMGDRLVWSTGEGRASLDVERGEVTVQ